MANLKLTLDQAKTLGLTDEQYNALVEKHATNGRTRTLSVSPKGAVAYGGLRRFKIVFYDAEWMDIFAHQDEIKAYIVEHKAELSHKD